MSEAEFISDEYPYWSGECEDDCDYCEIREECEERERRYGNEHDK